MIDTIHLTRIAPVGKDTIKNLIKVCGNSYKTVYTQSTKRIKHSGQIGKCHISFAPNIIKIRANLTKLLLGHNLNTSLAKFSVVKEALTKLSNQIGIALNDFSVSRVDIGRCFVLNVPIAQFTNTLNLLPQHDKNTYKTIGVKFTNDIRNLQFYNKTEELFHKEKKAGRKIFEELGINTEQILRYELQIKKPAKELKRKVYVRDLEQHYKILLEKYRTYFEKIQFQKDISVDFSNDNSREIKDKLLYIGADKIGFPELDKFLKINSNNEGKNYQNNNNLKKKLKEIGEQFKNIDVDNLLERITNSIDEPLLATHRKLLENMACTLFKTLKKLIDDDDSGIKKTLIDDSGIKKTLNSLGIDQKHLSNQGIALLLRRHIHKDENLTWNAYKEAKEIALSEQSPKIKTLKDFIKEIQL